MKLHERIHKPLWLGLIGMLITFSMPARASTFIGVDVGYQSLSLLTDLQDEAWLQMDVGGGWYWDGTVVGADYLKPYQRAKTTPYDPEIFYGFGGAIAVIRDSSFGLGFRLPFGVVWNLKDTPLQIGVSAVPMIRTSDSGPRVRIALSIPFRWRLD